MADTFKLSGTFKIETPPSINPSDANFDILGVLAETMSCKKKLGQVVTLDADGPEVFSFGDVPNAHLIIIKSDQPITIEVTSTSGALQAFPCGTLFILHTSTTPITALRLTRTPSVAAVVRVVIAEKVP